MKHTYGDILTFNYNEKHFYGYLIGTINELDSNGLEIGLIAVNRFVDTLDEIPNNTFGEAFVTNKTIALEEGVSKIFKDFPSSIYKFIITSYYDKKPITWPLANLIDQLQNDITSRR